MSGHSRWSQIKRKKGMKDEQKAKLFSKFARAITLAVTQGGGITDFKKNARLRLAIDRAKELRMPKDTMMRAVEKAVKAEDQQIKEVMYEGFAPFGVACLIVAFTDNVHRTLSEVRNTFEKNGGKLGSIHSVAHLFKRCCIVTFARMGVDVDQALVFASAIDALYIEESADAFIIYIPFEKMGHARELFGDLKNASIDIYYRPISTITIQSPDEARRILTLIDMLENLDDVHKVYANFDIPDQLIMTH